METTCRKANAAMLETSCNSKTFQEPDPFTKTFSFKTSGNKQSLRRPEGPDLPKHLFPNTEHLQMGDPSKCFASIARTISQEASGFPTFLGPFVKLKR
jgi:hypothetical protein